jgi:hypothetical protein
MVPGVPAAPGAKTPPLLMVVAPTVPVPANMAPEFTVTAVGPTGTSDLWRSIKLIGAVSIGRNH